MTDEKRCWNHTSSSEQYRTWCVVVGAKKALGACSSQFSLPGSLAAHLGLLRAAGSGGLFQRVDHLLQDVGAVVCYLLENGVGKLLQFCIVPLTFF